MPARIKVGELRSTPQSEGPLYQLAFESHGKQWTHPLPEGELRVGSSRLNDIRVPVPGVRSRHLRVKRSGSEVFVDPLGGAAIFQDGKRIEDLTPLLPARPFTFGSVTARLECLLPDDRRTAVAVAARSNAPIASDGEGTLEPAREPLGLVNNAVAECLRQGVTLPSDRLLEIVHRAFGGASAALFRRRTAARDWTLISECAVDGAPAVPEPEAESGWSRYSCTTPSEEFVLVVLPAYRAETSVQDDICRHVLLLTALGHRQGTGDGRRPPEPPATDRDDGWETLVGTRIRTELARSTELCRCSDSVLLLGETGTGKELAARSLHRIWARRGEFVALNCAAVPSDLLDAELFGIEAGTATGVSARRGRIDQAGGGTLFLDEIVDLPLPLQAKLLRVLQEREYFSVGGGKLRKADVKIVAASNQSAEYLRAGRLRQDLYFRLAQATLVLPALRDRADDLAALSEYFLNQFEQQFGRGITGLSVSALKRLKAYSWPGNVRELQNVLRSAYSQAAPGGPIRTAHLPDTLDRTLEIAEQGTMDAILEDVQKQVIVRELERSPRVADAAKALGLSEGYVYRVIKRFGLRIR